MEEKITITVSRDDYERIVRALKARASRWMDAEHLNKQTNATETARMYIRMANEIEEQVKGGNQK